MLPTCLILHLFIDVDDEYYTVVRPLRFNIYYFRVNNQLILSRQMSRQQPIFLL